VNHQYTRRVGSITIPDRPETLLQSKAIARFNTYTAASSIFPVRWREIAARPVSAWAAF
jgi:hypothetical protein